jgi:hypothetical protein
MPDFLLEPDEIEPERPDRRRPVRLVSTGLAPTAEVPTPRRGNEPAPATLVTTGRVCRAEGMVCGARRRQRWPRDQKECTMQEEQAGYATETPLVKAVRLPVMPCPACGLIDTPVLGPGRGPHVGELRCQAGHHIKWAPKALLGGKKEERAVGGIARCTVVGVISKHGVEVRYATSGSPCASLTLVVRERGQDGRPHDLYVPVEIWGRRAEAVSELSPGQLCLFEGRLAKRRRGEQWELVCSGFDLTPIVVPTPPGSN